MKKLFTISLLAVAGFMLMNMQGCGGTGGAPTNVQVEVINGEDGNYGGGLKVTWTAPDAATYGTPDEYKVYVDGAANVAVTGTTLEDKALTPGSKIEVAAVFGGTEYKSDAVDVAPEVTTAFHVWDASDQDPNHPSGFGFAVATGTVTAYSIAPANSDNWPSIDYWVAKSGSDQVLAAPRDHSPSLNSKGSAASEEGTNFNDVKMVKAPGNYNTQRTLSINAVYGLWLDDENDNLPNGDYFGKLQVTNIVSSDITMSLAFQLIPGLRWVVTE